MSYAENTTVPVEKTRWWAGGAQRSPLPTSPPPQAARYDRRRDSAATFSISARGDWGMLRLRITELEDGRP